MANEPPVQVMRGSIIETMMQHLEESRKHDAAMPAQEKELVAAVRAGDTPKIRQLIAQNVNLNSLDSMDQSPLYYAVQEQNMLIAELLIEAGADVNFTGMNAETALFDAVQENHPDMVKLLVNAGADVNAVDVFKRSPLWYVASQKGNMEMVKLLVEAGADVNAADQYGVSVMTVAVVDAMDIPLIQYLLQHGASPDIDKGYVESSLHPDCAFEQPEPQLIKALECIGYPL